MFSMKEECAGYQYDDITISSSGRVGKTQYIRYSLRDVITFTYKDFQSGSLIIDTQKIKKDIVSKMDEVVFRALDSIIKED